MLFDRLYLARDGCRVPVTGQDDPRGIYEPQN